MLGQVIGVHYGNDGLARKIKLKYKLSTEKSLRTVEKSIHGVTVIVPVKEQNHLMQQEKTTSSIEDK